ncbi:hypothetical protein GALMADRAFT_215256 [Galerina marginata CBS 339.88]|uniref:Uncharacterized protein n=1 Tax=Galerina marginata (strain CBS 339.88) TaxID=685588 RepID=A0A067SE76_GALM3|nr:hypothetical protein GALMADRAFT_215256 [Galerina marginata CBS 339.88]
MPTVPYFQRVGEKKWGVSPKASLFSLRDLTIGKVDMKQCTLGVGENRDFGTLSSDGEFVFSFATSDYRKNKEIAIDFYYKTKVVHRVTLIPSHSSVEDQVIIKDIDGETRSDKYLQLMKENVNIVIRVARTSDLSFSTYVNNEFISKVRSLAPKKMWKNKVTVASIGFSDSEREVIVTFAAFNEEFETTANNETQMIEPQHQEGAEGQQAESPEADREKAVEAREKAVEVKEKAVEVKEKAVGEQKKLLEESMKDVEERGKATARLEKVVAELQKSLEEKEKALEDREKTLNRGSGDGDVDTERKATSSSSVNPPDADIIKLSATVAWPRAIRHVLGASPADTLERRHDTLMQEWVLARGDDISSNAYDFFVYSHGVAWFKVVVENATQASLMLIMERHVVIMEVLA